VGVCKRYERKGLIGMVDGVAYTVISEERIWRSRFERGDRSAGMGFGVHGRE
jgi:hypothetical protein